MMEIGAGAAKSIKSSISNMGTNVMMIWPSAVKTSGISSGAGGSVTLTEADCAAIAAECLSVEAASPTLSRRGIQAIAGNRNWTPFTVYSGNEDYFIVQSWKTPESGRYFTKREVDTAACVCVIGQTVKEELFPGENPVGRDLRLNSVLFKVIGVLPRKGANMMGMDQDDTVVGPWRTMRNRLSRSGSSATGAGAVSSTTSSASTTRFFIISAPVIILSRFSSRGASSMREKSEASKVIAIFSASESPDAICLFGRVARTSVSIRTPRGWWNAPTAFFTPPRFTAVFPPIEEST
jgi:hypothetical protein